MKNGIHPNNYLQNSVNKYGIENFKFEILEEFPNNKYLLSSMEHYWCNLLNAHNRDFGYNLQPTNPYNVRVHSKETLQKMSNSNKGRKWTQSHRDNFIKSRNSYNWKPTITMIENSKKTNEKPILQIDKDGNIQEWGSITKACNTLNFGKKYISRCCSNKQETYKNYMWKFKNTKK